MSIVCNCYKGILYGLFTFCLILLPVNSTASAALAHQLEKKLVSNHLNSKLEQLCEVVGFNFNDASTSGNQVLTELQEKAIKKNQNLHFIQGAWDNLTTNGDSLVLRISSIQRRGESSHILAKVQSFLDHSLLSARPTRLVVMFEGTADFAQNLLRQQIDDMVHFVHLTKKNDQSVVVTYLQDSPQQISVIGGASRFAPSQESTFRSILKSWPLPARQQLVNKNQRKPRSPKLSEISALGYVESLIRSMQTSIEKELKDLTAVRLVRNVTAIRESLRAAIARANDDHVGKHCVLIDDLLQSEVSTIIIERIRGSLQQSLCSWSIQIVALLRKDCMRQFKQRMSKMPAKVPVKSFLQGLMAKTIEQYRKSVHQLSKEIEYAQQAIYGPRGLLSVPNFQCLHGYINIRYQVEVLKQELTTVVDQHLNKLFLDGLYNPFVRMYPFPPTHVNVNYLVNPADLRTYAEYRNLYDEHKDGFAYGRADPLEFPGVASIPFDPNQLPTPKVKPLGIVGAFWNLFSADEN